MNKEIDRLVRAFDKAVHEYDNDTSVGRWRWQNAKRKGISAVVRALREDARSVIDVEAMLEKILGEKNDAG